MPFQKLIFTAGLNSDSSPELVGEGEARYRLNVRVMSSDNAEAGAAEPVLGNTLATYTLPSGTNKVIGAVEDKKRGMIYYFVFNSLGSHTILQLAIKDNSITTVLQNSILNFQLDNLITGVNVVELDENNHLLYWTDNYVSSVDPNVYNEPRKINIEKAILHTSGNYTEGYKFPLDARIIYRIKQPPSCPPEMEWGGLPDQTPIPTVHATSDQVQVIPIGTGAIAKFNIDPGAPADNFNVATYQYTALTNEIVNVVTSGRYSWPGTGINFAVRATVNSTIVVRTNLYVDNSGPALPPGGILTQTWNSILLSAGDTLNIELAVGSTSTSAIQYTPLYFDVARIPISSADKVNHLFKKLYRAKYKFVYDDFEESAWSPITNWMLPKTTDNGTTGMDIALQDRYIDFTVGTGSSIVTKIKIAVEEIGLASQNDPVNFAEVIELNKAELGIADNSTYQWRFTNFSGAMPVEINDSIKLYDKVPLYSQAQELLSNNRLVDGNYTEEFDQVPIDMRLEIGYELVDTNPNSFYPKRAYPKSGGDYEEVIIYYDKWGNRSGLGNRTVGKFNEFNTTTGKYGTRLRVPFVTETDYNAPHADPNEDMKYVPIVNNYIYNPPPDWAYKYQIGRSRNLAYGRYIQFTVEKVEYFGGGGGIPINGQPADATTVRFYIGNIIGRFKDENPNSLLVYDFAEGDRLRLIADVAYDNFITLSPTSNDEIQTFYPFNDVPIVKFDSAGQWIEIAKSPEVPFWSTAFNVLRPGLLYEIYQPNNVIDEENALVYEMGECELIGTDVNGNRVHTGGEEDQVMVDFTVSFMGGSLITVTPTVFTPLNSGDKVKVICNNGASCYGVIQAVYLGGNITIDTTGFTPVGTITGAGILSKAAILKPEGWDCYRRIRNMPYEPGTAQAGTDDVYRLYQFIEDASVSDVFVSECDNTGRPNRIDDDIRRITRTATISYSDQLIPETEINGLSSVSSLSFQPYSQTYGGIYKLYCENNALIMFQELKVATIPIQQIIYNDLSLQNQVGASTVILSPQPVYYAGEYGIGQNPESFAVYGFAKYFVDIRRGSILRLSMDGITNISDTYKFHDHTTDLFKQLTDSGKRPKIYGVYDTKFSEYIVALESLTYSKLQGMARIDVTIPAETFAFNERFNAFSTFYSYHPDFMVGANQGILTFKTGKAYSHNDNSTYNNFYGVTYDSGMWIPVNQFPSNQKIYTAIAQETDVPWAVTLETPSGQTTSLLDSNFQMKEDYMYSEFLFDDNTPNVSNPRFEGNPMRGQTALLKLALPGGSYSKIFAVNVFFIPSNRSNK